MVWQHNGIEKKILDDIGNDPSSDFASRNVRIIIKGNIYKVLDMHTSIGCT